MGSARRDAETHGATCRRSQAACHFQPQETQEVNPPLLPRKRSTTDLILSLTIEAEKGIYEVGNSNGSPTVWSQL